MGQMGHRYRIMSLTLAIAKKYKAMAVLTTTLAAMPAPKNFKLYNGNRQALAAMPSKYHDLWYLRSFFELERFAAFGKQRLFVGPAVTVSEFTKVFPDSVGYLTALARHFRTNTVVTVMKRLGYTRRGLDPSRLTMHLCFLGQLHALRPDDIHRVRKSTLKKATRSQMNGHWHGHPHRIWSDASRSES